MACSSAGNGVLVTIAELPLTTLTLRYDARRVMALGNVLIGLGFGLNAVADTIFWLFVTQRRDVKIGSGSVWRLKLCVWRLAFETPARSGHLGAEAQDFFRASGTAVALG